MPAGKGTRPPAAGMGRKKGVPNKITADIKAMILAALNAKGGQAYLERQADENPVAFMGLLAKILPLQVSGQDDGPLEIRWISYADAWAGGVHPIGGS